MLFRSNWLTVVLACVSFAGLGLISSCGGGGGTTTPPASSSKSYQFLIYGQTGRLLVPVNFQLTVN